MPERLLNDVHIVVPIFLGILVVLLSAILLQKKEVGLDKSVGLSREEALTESKATKNDKPVDKRVLHPVTFKPFRLIKSTKTSHNTKLLRFEIPNGRSIGLPIGRHLSVMAMIEGNKVIRSYTPVSKPEEQGYFELLMKRYEYGKMSSYLFALEEGACVDMRGPVGRFKYHANLYNTIGLVCGGTGLTPCLQVIRVILEGESADDEKTKLVLLYQNRNEEDILLRECLCDLQKEFPGRLEVYFFLSSPPSDWGHHGRPEECRGYISEESMHSLLPPSSTDMVGLCGPSGFNEAMVKKLEQVGFDKEQQLFVW